MLERFTIRPRRFCAEEAGTPEWSRRGQKHRFKCLPPHVERLGAGRFVRIKEHHSGVVDEDVEPPMLVLDRSRRLLDAVAAVHVDDDAVRIDALLAQLFRITENHILGRYLLQSLADCAMAE
jgi:hypothetical protein